MTDQEPSVEWQRGWAACLAGSMLTLGIGRGCDSPDYADGYLACMKAYGRGGIDMTKAWDGLR